MSDERTTVTVETPDGWVTIDVADITSVCVPRSHMTHYSWIETTAHEGPIVVDTPDALASWAAWTGRPASEHPAAQGSDEAGSPLFFEREGDPMEDG